MTPRTRVLPSGDQTVRELARLVAGCCAPGRTHVVAVDGRTGSGKTTLAAALRAELVTVAVPVQVLAVDDVVPGWRGLAEGVARVRDALTEVVRGRAAAVDTWDWDAMRPGPTRVVHPVPGGVLLVEGSGSTAAVGRAATTIRLEVPFEVRRRRIAARDAHRWDVDAWERQEAAVGTAREPDVVVLPTWRVTGLTGWGGGSLGRSETHPPGDTMSVAVRVIPCLDVKDGRVVKGVNFRGLRDAGDPVELARRYDAEGADEITFLDVSASAEGRATMKDVVSRTAEQVFVPLTVGGGVRTVDDVDRLLRAGADKVGINTAAIARPELLSEVAERFGNQVIVLSVDARRCPEGVTTPSGYEVTTHGGRTSTGIDAVGWAVRAAALGVGEILLNSMDADGVTGGFDLEMLDDVRAVVSIPVIASGGAGRPEDFAAAADHGADAVLAASVFHYGTMTIGQAKDALRAAGHPVR